MVVFSGSDKQKLEETFGKLNVWLAAENGIFMRPPGGEWSTLLEVSQFSLPAHSVYLIAEWMPFSLGKCSTSTARHWQHLYYRDRCTSLMGEQYMPGITAIDVVTLMLWLPRQSLPCICISIRSGALQSHAQQLLAAQGVLNVQA